MKAPLLKAMLAALCLGVSGGAAAAGDPEPVAIYAAGSLRNTVNALSGLLSARYNIQVQATFGSSGGLRERIEHGEQPDMLLSADLGSPHKLAAAGRTVLPVIPIARNAMCIVSPRSLGLTPQNFSARMLRDKVRVKTSTPVADPAGDYAWAIFDRIEARHHGAAAVLQEKARRSMNLTPPAGAQNPLAGLFESHQIDLTITYCSGAPAILQAVPELTSMPVPSELDPHPVYGAALLADKPAAMRALLVLLSDEGQAIVRKAGLLPLLADDEPTRAAPHP